LSFPSSSLLHFFLSSSIIPYPSCSRSRDYMLTTLCFIVAAVPSQTSPFPPSQLPTFNSIPPVERPSFLVLDLPPPPPTLPTPPPLHPQLKVPNSTTLFFLLRCPRRLPKLFVPRSLFALASPFLPSVSSSCLAKLPLYSRLLN